MMKNKIVWILIGLVFMSLAYYLFLRSAEFEVNFEAKTSTGDLIQTIRIWHRSLNGEGILQVDSFAHVTQPIVWEGNYYIFNWNFSDLNDSTTAVNIQISQPGRSFLNKILVPFTEQPIERDARTIGELFYDILDTHLKITDVRIIGETELDSSFCVCRELKTTQIEKANGMMRDYTLLTSFIDFHHLKVKGLPSVRVTEWSHNRGTLKFDFCFPIQANGILPSVDSLNYKQFESMKVLKAEYNGNYITSDRTWYELIRYAQRKGYEVQRIPIEYFHDNPNLGMNESKWKTEVYLPIKN